MLTVACVLVRGHVAFTPEYVRRLHSMALRRIGRAFEFVCLTDQPEAMPRGVRAIKIKLPPGLKGWWAKIELFRPGRFGGRVLYLDLDTLLIDALDEIIDYPADFALAPCGAPAFKAPDGLATVKRFNSSCMVWDWDVPLDVYRKWTPAVAARLWGDQDWIGELCADARTMPADWFPRLSTQRARWPADSKVVLCKRPKNADAALMWDWFDEAWR